MQTTVNDVRSYRLWSQSIEKLFELVSNGLAGSAGESQRQLGLWALDEIRRRPRKRDVTYTESQIELFEAVSGKEMRASIGMEAFYGLPEQVPLPS